MIIAMQFSEAMNYSPFGGVLSFITANTVLFIGGVVLFVQVVLPIIEILNNIAAMTNKSNIGPFLRDKVWPFLRDTVWPFLQGFIAQKQQPTVVLKEATKQEPNQPAAP